MFVPKGDPKKVSGFIGHQTVSGNLPEWLPQNKTGTENVSFSQLSFVSLKNSDNSIAHP